jgi:hypothetical protein
VRHAATALALLVALSTPAAASESCVAFRLKAWGRPGHAASLDLHAAPHRLIRGLGALLPAGERGLAAVRVRGLAAAGRPNVKPSTSEALVEVTAEGSRAAVVARVEELLAEQAVAVEALADPCRPDGPPAATTAGSL